MPDPVIARCPRLTYAYERGSGQRWKWPGEPIPGRPVLFQLVRCNYEGTAEQIHCHRIVTHRLPRWSALLAPLVYARTEP